MTKRITINALATKTGATARIIIYSDGRVKASGQNMNARQRETLDAARDLAEQGRINEAREALREGGFNQLA